MPGPRRALVVCSALAALFAACGCATPAPQVPDADRLSPAARDRYVAAFEALRADDPAAALVAVEPLLEVEPWHVAAHALRQDAMRAQGRVEEAARWYSERSAAAPDDARRLLLAARLGPRERDAREQAYRRVVELDADLPWGSIALAYELLRQAEDASAAETALLDGGYRAEAEEAGAAAQEALREALVVARHAAGSRPRLAAAHAALGAALLAQPDASEAVVAEALEHATRAAELDPGNPVRHALVASARRRAQDDAGAATALAQALELRPRDAVLLGNAGRVYLDLDRAGDARDVLERAVEVAPEDAVLHMNLGVARHRTEDLEAARASLTRACELSHDDPRPYEALALVLAEAGDPEAAVLAMNRYLELGGSSRSSARRFIEDLGPRP